jgi:hypothetical protein
MVEVILVGAETCHRYQRMREIVRGAAARLGIPVHLSEENEVQGILKYNTVNLPLLFIGGELIAQMNPPSQNRLETALRRSSTV